MQKKDFGNQLLIGETTLPIFMCNKLARDKTAQNFKESNITATHRIISGKELHDALYKKLLEEALEVTQAVDRKEIISELVDVLDVIEGLRNALDISHDEIEVARNDINDRRGCYQNGLFLTTIEMSEENPAVNHFRKSPEKYQEIVTK